MNSEQLTLPHAEFSAVDYILDVISKYRFFSLSI